MESQCWEIWQGRRLVSLKTTQLSARKTIVEYLRSTGSGIDEMALLTRNSIGCRGEIYRAVPLGSE